MLVGGVALALSLVVILAIRDGAALSYVPDDFECSTHDHGIASFVLLDDLDYPSHTAHLCDADFSSDAFPATLTIGEFSQDEQLAEGYQQLKDGLNAQRCTEVVEPPCAAGKPIISAQPTPMASRRLPGRTPGGDPWLSSRHTGPTQTEPTFRFSSTQRRTSGSARDWVTEQVLKQRQLRDSGPRTPSCRPHGSVGEIIGAPRLRVALSR